MNTSMARVDDAVRRLVEIHDSRAGRAMTNHQAEGFDLARRDLHAALADSGSTLGDLARSLAERVAATSDPELAENYVRQLSRNLERDRIVSGTSTFREEIAARTDSWSRPDSHSFTEMLKNFRSHGYATYDLEPSERYTTRALQSAGGSAVPTDFADRVAMYMRYATPMLDGSIVTVENRPTGNPLVFPRLTADPSSGGTVTAEGAGITVGDATISSVTIQPFGYKYISEWSRELHEDEVIGLEDLIARSIARELSISAGQHLTTGTGTTVPWGIVTRASNGGTATGGTAVGSTFDTFFAPADLVDLKYSVPKGYRANGAYMVSTGALSKIRKFRDRNAAMLFGVTQGGVPTFDGSPLIENPQMASPGSATKSVMFGDLSAYTTVRVATRIELSYDAKWGTDQVSLRVVDRISGDMPDTAAVSYQIAANS